MWAYIKKAINSNLSVPLSDTIGNIKSSLIPSVFSDSGYFENNNSYATLLEITGEGVLNKAVITQASVSTSTIADTKIKITIDGVVKVELATNDTDYNDNFVVGFCIHNMTYQENVNATYTYTGLGNRRALNSNTYPDTTLGQRCIITYFPIYFSSSLKIEVATKTDTNLRDIPFHYDGGVFV